MPETPADADAEEEAAAEPSGIGGKRGPKDNDEPGEVRSAKKTAMTAKDVEMEDWERKDQAFDGPAGLEIATGAAAAAESVSYRWIQATSA